MSKIYILKIIFEKTKIKVKITKNFNFYFFTLKNMYKDIKIFEENKNLLEKKDTIFIVSDFDDTIFSTKEILDKDVRKWRRWNEWNKYIEEVIWIENFVKDFYENKIFPKNITKNFSKENTLILTAWFENLQNAKLKATWLDIFPVKIVYESFEKPFEMVKYIIENLKFIPKEIHIFEDRPNHFLSTKNEIEDFLWTKIKIFFVEMKDNFSEPKITEI